jgi:hypothetical protein
VYDPAAQPGDEQLAGRGVDAAVVGILRCRQRFDFARPHHRLGMTGARRSNDLLGEFAAYFVDGDERVHAISSWGAIPRS